RAKYRSSGRRALDDCFARSPAGAPTASRLPWPRWPAGMSMKRFADLPPKLRLHIGGVVLLGLGLTAYIALGRALPAAPHDTANPWLLPALLVWMVVCSLARLNLGIPGAMMTLGSVSVSLAQFKLGTLEAMLIAGLGAAVTMVGMHQDATRKGHTHSDPGYRWLFNVCNCLVAAGLGGLAYDWVMQRAHFPEDMAMLFSSVVWVLVYFSFNTAGVAMAIALGSNQPVGKVWRERFLFTAPGYLVSVSLSLIIVQTLPRWGPW